ncbi:MAG: hypothetical protein ABIQ49_00325 [Gemmatimonadales bacterium]
MSLIAWILALVGALLAFALGVGSAAAGLIEALAVRVADLDHRVVDQPKPDPEGTCKQ